MGTFHACGVGGQLVEGIGSPMIDLPPAQDFAPTEIDTDTWLAALKSFGAKRAVLVVSHGCGFNTFPSKTAFPEFGFEYNDFDICLINLSALAYHQRRGAVPCRVVYITKRFFVLTAVLPALCRVQSARAFALMEPLCIPAHSHYCHISRRLVPTAANIYILALPVDKLSFLFQLIKVHSSVC